MVRNLVCFLIVVFMPFSLMAADQGAAMAHPYGAAWLNGTAVEHATVIFPGDLLQTNPDSVLKIETPGSSVTVLSDSLVKFDGGSATVERGSAKLRTSGTMSVRAGIVTVTPASGAPTEFQVTNAAGTVQVVALKGDLQISNGSETKALPQGQQATQAGSDDNQKMANGGVVTGTSKPAPFAIEAAKAKAEPEKVLQKPTPPKRGSPHQL